MLNGTDKPMGVGEARAVLEAGLVSAREVRGGLAKALDGLSDEQWVHQAFEGANHALWNVGHLACVDAWFLGCVGGDGEAVKEAWMDRFWIGSEPAPGLDANPPVAEVRRALGRTREALVAHLRGLPDEDLLLDCGEPLAHAAPTRAHMPSLMAWHDANHMGQVFMSRRSMALPFVLFDGDS